MSNWLDWLLLLSAVILVPPLWLLWRSSTGTRDRLMWAGLAATGILMYLDFWTSRRPNPACYWGIPLMFVTNAFLLYRKGDASDRSTAQFLMPLGVALAAMPLVYTLFPGFGGEWALIKRLFSWSS